MKALPNSFEAATGLISTPTTSEYCRGFEMAGAPAFTKNNEEQLRPLGSSANNRWAVSETRANLVRPPLAPRPVTVQADVKLLTIDLARTAIIVIDMQNDFCHPDGWLAHNGVDVVPARAPIEPLQRLLPALRTHDVPVIWLNWGNRPDQMNLSPALLHVYKPSGAGIGLGDPLPGSGARVLERGSWSAAIVDELTADPKDIHVAKYRMSGFRDTELDSILRNLGVTTLMFAGVNADQCVLCTLQDANFRGYDCLLLEDCTATTSPDYCMAATIYNIRQCFGFIIRSVSLMHESVGNDCASR
jgi:nicotinamidase-related amidase